MSYIIQLSLLDMIAIFFSFILFTFVIIFATVAFIEANFKIENKNNYFKTEYEEYNDYKRNDYM